MHSPPWKSGAGEVERNYKVREGKNTLKTYDFTMSTPVTCLKIPITHKKNMLYTFHKITDSVSISTKRNLSNNK
jgi:hypothetical protein